MKDATLAAAVDANYFATFRLLGDLMERGAVHDRGGILSVATGLPVAFMNIAFVTRPLVNPEAAILESVDFFDRLGLPFVVRVRDGVDERAEATLEALGLPYSDTVPGMALAPLPAIPATPPPLEVRKVDGPLVGRFCRVMADAFGMPAEVVRPMANEAILANPRCEYLLGLCDGEPVATSALMRSAGVAGVYNVAVAHAYRRRGLGETMTWEAVRRGQESGCTIATLQASGMGQPVYERMGFRLVAPYRTFHR